MPNPHVQPKARVHVRATQCLRRRGGVAVTAAALVALCVLGWAGGWEAVCVCAQVGELQWAVDVRTSACGRGEFFWGGALYEAGL